MKNNTDPINTERSSIYSKTFEDKNGNSHKTAAAFYKSNSIVESSNTTVDSTDGRRPSTTENASEISSSLGSLDALENLSNQESVLTTENASEISSSLGSLDTSESESVLTSENALELTLDETTSNLSSMSEANSMVANLGTAPEGRATSSSELDADQIMTHFPKEFTPNVNAGQTEIESAFTSPQHYFNNPMYEHYKRVSDMLQNGGLDSKNLERAQRKVSHQEKMGKSNNPKNTAQVPESTKEIALGKEILDRVAKKVNKKSLSKRDIRIVEKAVQDTTNDLLKNTSIKPNTSTYPSKKEMLKQASQYVVLEEYFGAPQENLTNKGAKKNAEQSRVPQKEHTSSFWNTIKSACQNFYGIFKERFKNREKEKRNSFRKKHNNEIRKRANIKGLSTTTAPNRKAISQVKIGTLTNRKINSYRMRSGF